VDSMVHRCADGTRHCDGSDWPKGGAARYGLRVQQACLYAAFALLLKLNAENLNLAGRK